ncbi:CHAT domain-containing protein [Aequorivita xiaoshiensis]|uniref:CHAT domain-containing protein n=1 Tax=Aequorivita xiaoshiensis TaxID=2874476 RepID=A0A9X1QXN6_9FLAO|nr:CHAT domain-containing protein [Aequorivita xiaoshiensis]MCG2429783.1 CHAT domain-containing protein [Aequorivita xiaoshiensis]
MEILKKHIIGTLFFLICIGSSVAQTQEVEAIYSRLDSYLEQPDSDNQSELLNVVEATLSNDKEVLLAKTIAYCNIGYIETQNKALQKAIEVYEKAKQMFFSENLSNYDIIEYCLKPLGNLYIKTQALSEAENTIKHYIIYARETGQTKQQVSGVLNLSVLYHNRGEFHKAKNILLQALKESPTNHDLKINLASAYYALHQIEETKNLLNDVLKSNSNNPKAYQLLAQVNLSEKENSKAILNLRKAIKLLHNASYINFREVAKMKLSLAETYFVSGQIESSLSHIQQIYKLLIPSYNLEQYLPKNDQLYAETILMDALDLQGNVFINQSNLDEALEAFSLASEVSDYLFAELYVQGSKLLAQQDVKRRSEMMMEVFYKQYQSTKNKEWIAKAVHLDNKVKGRIVSEAMFLKAKLNSLENKKFSEFRRLQKEFAVINDQIQKQILNNNLEYDKLAHLQKEYSALLTKQRIEYSNIQSEIANSLITNSIVDLDEIIHKATISNQTLVSYFVGSEMVYQIVISKEKLIFQKIVGSKTEHLQFTEAIRSYSRFFDSPATINNDIPLFTASSLKLFKILQLPEAENLIIIPDGILSFIPFQTLLTSESSIFKYAEMPFLIFKSTVSYTISFTEYLRNTSSLDEKQSVLGVFPVFKNSVQELEYSVNEAKAITEVFKSDLLMETQATVKNFVTSVNSHTILHLSTHATGGSFSSGPSISFFDRTFSVEELYGHQFSNQLVILSACDTGVGKVVKGEGALSLARGFQYAGASNVLFSLWQVNDKSTAELMEYYYQNLSKNRSRNLSLHRASINYLQNKTIDNTRKSPYYWGAFVYYGATDTPQEKRNISSLSFLIFLIPLIGIGVWYFKKRKKT